MTNAQKWTIIILSFMLAITFIVGGYVYACLKTVESISLAPAVTSEFSISGELKIEGKDIDGVPVSLRIDNIYGKVNSKILDLILLAIDTD